MKRARRGMRARNIGLVPVDFLCVLPAFRAPTQRARRFSVPSVFGFFGHGEHRAAEPQCQIPDSKFKTLAPRKVCQKSKKLRPCITDTSYLRLAVHAGSSDRRGIVAT